MSVSHSLSLCVIIQNASVTVRVCFSSPRMNPAFKFSFAFILFSLSCYTQTETQKLHASLLQL